MTRGARSRWLLVAVALTPLLATPGTAQERFVVGGRVLDSDAGRGVQNAVVTLEGRRPTLTGASGDFSFADIAEGEYVLRVEAFGYVAYSTSLRVRDDVTLAVGLEVAPFVLDSLVVAPIEVEVRGRVRDPAEDLSIRDADVHTSLGEVTRTNGVGRFDVRGWEGNSLLLLVRAFGYLPLDTVVTPGTAGRHLFDVEPDPLVQRMIDAEVRRLDQRARGQRAVTMRPLNRADLLRRRGFTLLELLMHDYGLRARRLRCVVLDERSLTPSMADGVVRTMLAQDVERIEFLFRGKMLRIYTREFMRTMLGGGVELRRPVYVEYAKPPVCT